MENERCIKERRCREERCQHGGFTGIGAILVLYILLIIILGCTSGLVI